jgi:hypothetical protein
MRQYVRGDYRGVDGSGPFADAIVDLCHYRSDADGVFLRHVLEHNPEWRSILTNALASARRRCVIVLWNADIGVPDLALPRHELEAALSEHSWTALSKESQTQYGGETVLLISAPGVEHDNAAEHACGCWSPSPSS